MQTRARIDSTNTNTYGDGVSSAAASGYLTNASFIAGRTIRDGAFVASAVIGLNGSGANSESRRGYRRQRSATQGQRGSGRACRYRAGTGWRRLDGWRGRHGGGVVVVDVSDLNLNGATIDVTGRIPQRLQRSRGGVTGGQHRLSKSDQQRGERSRRGIAGTTSGRPALPHCRRRIRTATLINAPAMPAAAAPTRPAITGELRRRRGGNGEGVEAATGRRTGRWLWRRPSCPAGSLPRWGGGAGSVTRAQLIGPQAWVASCWCVPEPCQGRERSPPTEQPGHQRTGRRRRRRRYWLGCRADVGAGTAVESAASIRPWWSRWRRDPCR